MFPDRATRWATLRAVGVIDECAMIYQTLRKESSLSEWLIAARDLNVCVHCGASVGSGQNSEHGVAANITWNSTVAVFNSP
jgi:hypothetical protein